MNKIFRTTILFVFLMLYGFIISYYSGNVASANLAFTDKHHSQSDIQYTLISKNLLCHTTDFKTLVNSVNSVNNTLPTNSKYPFSDFSANCKTIEHKFLNRFQQYILFSKNISVRFRQTDLIFPFHYFW